MDDAGFLLSHHATSDAIRIGKSRRGRRGTWSGPASPARSSAGPIVLDLTTGPILQACVPFRSPGGTAATVVPRQRRDPLNPNRGRPTGTVVEERAPRRLHPGGCPIPNRDPSATVARQHLGVRRAIPEARDRRKLRLPSLATKRTGLERKAIVDGRRLRAGSPILLPHFRAPTTVRRALILVGGRTQPLHRVLRGPAATHSPGTRRQDRGRPNLLPEEVLETARRVAGCSEIQGSAQANLRPGRPSPVALSAV